jgi:hypothetical protein
MDEIKSPPLLAAGRRAANRRRFADNYGSTNNAKTPPPQATTVTIVETIIGRMRVALRIESYIYDPGISSYEARAYKTGPRKGLLRQVRVWGGHRHRRMSIRRYRDAALAAYAYHATRRALGIGLPPFRRGEASFALMGWAQLTAAGANCAAGQEFAARMKSLGVQIANEPLKERRLGEFWWADF